MNLFCFSFIVCFVEVLSNDVGDRLILTKYLENGDIIGGQNAAKVDPIIDGVVSYAGYFTVDPKFDSNLFFWYFPGDDPDAPVIVWLQGGPGGTSMYGLLYENGPLKLVKDKAVQRDYAWTKVGHMVYIDNPVGTGFSFTNSTKGYATTEEQIGNSLYTMILQFFTLFPHLQKNDFYITGESYAGKYIPAMAYTIHLNNINAKIVINLKGITMGDGLCDPINMLVYGEYLYQVGLITKNIKNKFEIGEKFVKSLIEKGDFQEATRGWEMLVGDKSILVNETGFGNHYNYYYPSSDQKDMDNMEMFLNQSWIRKRIHAGNSSFSSSSSIVFHYLYKDMLKTIVPKLKTVANNYKVLVYNGQLDIIVAYPLTVNFLRNFEWCGREDYLATSRKLWFVDDRLAGYTRSIKPDKCDGSLIEILVRNSGHMVPLDQPKLAFDIISKFVNNEEF